ncbi:MAG: GAF domain-containing protein [bacterium]
MEKDVYKSLTAITESLLEKKEINSVFESITKTACSFFDAFASSIMLFDNNKEYLTIARSYNLSADYLRVVKVHRDQEVAGKVCQTKKPRFIPDVLKLFREIDDDFTVQWAGKEGIVSLVCAPLLIKEEPIGCLNIYYRNPQATFEKENALEFFTRLAALAIEYSRMISQSEGKTQALTVLEEVGLFLTSSFSINEIMRVFLSTAVSITNSDVGALVLVDDTGTKVLDAFEYNKDTDLPKRYIKTARLTNDISIQTLKTQKPVVISDLSKHGNINPINNDDKKAATVAVPLIARGKPIGILYVDSFTQRDYSRNEIDYLVILCNQAAIALNNTELYKKITREAQEMALLYEISQSFMSTLDFDKLLTNILQRLKDTLGYLNLAIMLVDEEKQELFVRSYINYPEYTKKMRFKIGRDGITGHVAQTKKMYYSPDLSKDPHYIVGAEKAKSELCFPLMLGEKVIGVLDVESPELNGFTEDDMRLVSAASAQIAVALYNAQLFEQTKALSLTDPLTALPNRRSFDMFIDAEIRRAGRYHRSFSVLMIDFDNFKKYNDAFGHPAGDKILRKYSNLMKSAIRDVDLLGRHGGDEFIAVLPETDSTFALEVAERMRKTIAAQAIEPRITLSIGIAAFPQDGDNKNTLVEIADNACYEAKQLGGDCVNFASRKKE